MFVILPLIYSSNKHDFCDTLKTDRQIIRALPVLHVLKSTEEELKTRVSLCMPLELSVFRQEFANLLHHFLPLAILWLPRELNPDYAAAE